MVQKQRKSWSLWRGVQGSPKRPYQPRLLLRQPKWRTAEWWKQGEEGASAGGGGDKKEKAAKKNSRPFSGSWKTRCACKPSRWAAIDRRGLLVSKRSRKQLPSGGAEASPRLSSFLVVIWTRFKTLLKVRMVPIGNALINSQELRI